MMLVAIQLVSPPCCAVRSCEAHALETREARYEDPGPRTFLGPLVVVCPRHADRGLEIVVNRRGDVVGRAFAF